MSTRKIASETTTSVGALGMARCCEKVEIVQKRRTESVIMSNLVSAFDFGKASEGTEWRRSGDDRGAQDEWNKAYMESRFAND